MPRQVLGLAPISILLLLAAACGETERRQPSPPVVRDASTSRMDAGAGQDATTSTKTDSGEANPDAGMLDPDADLSDVDRPDSVGFPDAGDHDSGPTDTGEGPPDAGFDSATITPLNLDFGRTVVGLQAVLTATIANNTSSQLVVRLGTLAGGEAADYSFTVTPTTATSSNAITLRAGEQVGLHVTFLPSAVGARNATLDVELCDAGCTAQLMLAGEGLLEAFDCQPQVVNFGRVSPGNCRDSQATCTNNSSHWGRIRRWSLGAGSDPAFTVQSSFPLGGVLVAPGAVRAIDLRYCPTAFGNDSGTIDIDVAHPDPNLGLKTIPLLGQGGGPDIRCQPTSVDVGTIAVGQTARAQVRCENRGNVNLSVTSAALQMGAPASAALEARINGAPQTFPLSLPPMTSLDLDLSWAPSAPATLATAIEVASNDADTPNVSVPVSGEAVDASGCMVSLSQATLDFGAVAIGSSAQLSADVVNAGNGTCVVQIQPIAGTSPFSIVTSPTSGSIGPGQSFPVTIAFTPAAAQAYSASIQIQATDVLTPMLTLNVTGAGGILDSIQVSPRLVDFGTTPVGCGNAAVRQLSITNLDRSAATITVALTSGAASFLVSTGTVATFLVPSGDTVDVPISFRPPAVASYQGSVRVSVLGTAAPIIVGLRGAGGTAAQNVERWPAMPSQEVDMLLVVDDSCSMAEEQALLSGVAPALIARADAAGADYHIGVTTTDPTSGIAGRLRGNPPAYIEQTSPTRAADLSMLIMAGTNGSAIEEGLYTAAEAVTNGQLLAGQNAGFLRPNGELSVVILSDEPDQSPNTVAHYINVMRNRPIGMQGSLRISTLTGGLTGCNSPTSGSAGAAPRYVQAANLTGGIEASICASDYAPIIGQIADLAFGSSRETFQLGSQPAPGSIEVRINGTIVPTVTGTVARWFVDYENARVVFASGRGPARTANVEIRYNAFCVPATCGNGTPQAGEQCDDGNGINTDACPDTCHDAFCGDGYVQAGVEQCDDLNAVPGDGCNQTCTIEGCGNAIVEPGEMCDDGPANSDVMPNACRTDCTSPSCGDGVPDMGELCDDGNGVNTDACLIGCVPASCGDGFVQTGVEQCDDGNMIDTDACNNACMWTVAGLTVTTTPNMPLVPTQGTPFTTSSGSRDDGYAAIAIGFPFSFLGTSATNVYVSTNGFITFNTGGATSYTNVAIPSAAAPNSMVAWWWDDLHTMQAPTTAMTTALTGTAPNRIRVITLIDVARYGGSSGLLDVEIRLHETTNVVEVHYGTLDGAAGSTFGASAGWEDSSGMRGQDVLGCAPNCTAASWPANTVFTYTP